MSQKIAHFPLDFAAEQSVCDAKGAARMGPATLETTLKSYIPEMQERLDQAAGIANAANACADASNISKAIETPWISSN